MLSFPCACQDFWCVFQMEINVGACTMLVRERLLDLVFMAPSRVSIDLALLPEGLDDDKSPSVQEEKYIYVTRTCIPYT